jgi:hypothetical protein
MAVVETINSHDYTKQAYSANEYADMRGVVDFGNLMQFAPYEGGYCFLAVINGPAFAQSISELPQYAFFQQLQEAFIKILEQEFKGLSGIENISTETMDITDNVSTLSLISKVNQPSNGTISMQFTEKTGSLITKYISFYLRFIKDPKSEAKTYGGAITAENATTMPGFHKEVFNMLYIVTDSTCLNIEKAFLILNAQPTEAAYSDLYNATKGDISSKEVDVTFNAFVVDGALPNKIAHVYMRNLVKTSQNTNGKINLNSYDFNWSISGINGEVLKGGSSEDGGVASLNVNPTDGTITPSGSVNVSEAVNEGDGGYETYSPS